MSGVGAVARVPAVVRTPHFDLRRCKQCGLCAHVCPVGILELPLRSAPTLPAPEDCTGCRACEFICPDFAVTMVGATV